jgi:hypothetical protein
LTYAHARSLIRGLIHSDGSRVIKRFKTVLPSGRVAEYSYVRYFFTNYSATFSVAHRDSVAIVDSFVGPKR